MTFPLQSFNALKFGALILFVCFSFGVSGQCDYLEIIEKYAPKIYLHNKDIHRPMNVETFIEASTLYDKNEQVILSDVTLDDLTNPLYNSANYDLGNYTYQGNYYGPENVQSDRTGDPLNADNEVTSKCYVKILEYEGHTDIVYSFFYQWNGFQLFQTKIQDSSFPFIDTYVRNFEWRDFARHEGDWEHVTVRLTPDLEEIIGIIGSAHGDSRFYSIEDPILSFDGTHPIFYSAPKFSCDISQRRDSQQYEYN